MSTFVELEKQVQKNANLERRIADLEAENALLRELTTDADIEAYREWVRVRQDVAYVTRYHDELADLRAQREAL